MLYRSASGHDIHRRKDVVHRYPASAQHHQPSKHSQTEEGRTREHNNRSAAYRHDARLKKFKPTGETERQARGCISCRSLPRLRGDGENFHTYVCGCGPICIILHAPGVYKTRITSCDSIPCLQDKDIMSLYWISGIWTQRVRCIGVLTSGTGQISPFP